jgi:hypothetical protein
MVWPAATPWQESAVHLHDTGTALQANAHFGVHGLKIASLDMPQSELAALAMSTLRTLLDTPSQAKVKLIIVRGRHGGAADGDPVVSQPRREALGMSKTLKSSGVALTTAAGTPLAANGTRSMRSTRTNLSRIEKPLTQRRATGIVCTLGPACWSEAGLRGLLDAGCDIVRLNFSHGSHDGAHRLEVSDSATAARVNVCEP